MWKFEIVNVERTQAPLADQRGNWYRYTIANHVTEITGTRCGNRNEVMNFVKMSIQRLNNRHRAASFSGSRV